MKVLVLREGVHGMPAADYAAELRDRLPDHDVVHARTREEEREEIRDARVATGVRVDRSLIDAAERLELFACAYAGHDHLPLSALRERDVAVTNATGVHAPNVAEHVVGSVLAFSRNFPEALRRGRRGEWRPYDVGELKGSTATVVGLGNIGRAIVERLDPFGVETVGVRRDPSKGGPADDVRGTDGLDAALSRTDYLVLACPLTDETEGLVGRSELVTLPPDAVLVNVARGPVVETDALVTALRRDELAGAALDVTDPEPLPDDHPLWNFENVLVTPHNAGATPRYYERLADIVAENAKRGAEEGFENLRNQVA